MSPEQIEVERKAFEAHKPFSESDLRWSHERYRYHWNDMQRTWEAWLARAEKAQRVSAQLQFAIDIMSRIPALGSSAQVEAMRAVLKD